ncbi:hypothetical protein VCB98_12575 [Gammaproteobacteria bacterium AB-CW1]|uniref:Uncharacterized protein n=1 Tax=Natronospira elongata TaxID=3110268 RepID=A0AAP6MKN7_9GAMM|nr:hypothetical protein [Gammaproteobacteria bacterium AB-CW1]
MKSQELLVAMKLASLGIHEARRASKDIAPKAFAIRLPDEQDGDWQPWSIDHGIPPIHAEVSATNWTHRDLAKSLNISLSACNRAIHGGLARGLLRRSPRNHQILPNAAALEEFLIHGAKYVFPTEYKAEARGLPTCFAAPVLSDHLSSAGSQIYVWPDPFGNTQGTVLVPLNEAVVTSVKGDPILYGLLALFDSIRSGQARERNLAIEQLKKELSWL